MKHDTVLVIVRCLLYAMMGAGTALVSGLGQWANSPDASPSRINWVIIISGAVVAGATQVSSFLSSAYSDWAASRKESSSPTVGDAPKTP